MLNQRFAAFAWANVAYNLLVILGGAFVRATGSGAGCGDHWPLCDGQVIPRAPSTEMMIEFTHRVTSGLALLGTLALLIWAWRAYAPGHIVRKAALVAMIFMIIEALLGAALVVLELVAMNTSMTRAVMMALHLANTFLLLGALVLTAWWASGGAPITLRGHRKMLWLLGVGLFGTILVGSSGAVTALGDTLLQHGALPGGVDQPVTRDSHLLIQMRIIHPIIGLIVGIYTLFLARTVTNYRPGKTSSRLAWTLVILFFVQILLGGLNVTLKAPVWMQLVHLFMADLVWAFLVLLSAAALAQPAHAQAAARSVTSRPVRLGT
ncbi:COX15/CtaA family protein [Candidatus Chloroploca asiatica]|uniref:Cytochrome oxidase assembly protein n=1 Tax=Candidatus Chloroploca asiatica TaxID=1506545 RepID=A0A2H3L4B2_9CHLR|nr:COX15/CtaA family protein [Candidatus Chloroploca asiatica]PDV97080.1 cytochrome oxidase assembly protein [Candidatus Chloroploca asiatica]